MTIVDAVGWIGAFCFAICSIPQAVQCYQQKNADGVSSLFLFLWVCGEVLSIAYVSLHEGMTAQSTWPLIFNYAINLMGISVIIWYKLK